MFADLRYVLRVLLRMKGFTAVTVLTLALGLGSAGAIFSTVDWVLFRSLDFPDGLVFVGARDKQGAEIPVIIDAEVQAYQQASAAFSETALAAVEAVNAVVDGTPLETGVLGVSPNFLGVLGVTPAIGRDFRAEEGVPGRNDVVIIGHSLWQRQFAGADDVLGRTLVVDGRACTIIGVLRARQSMPTYFYAEVLRPLVYQINPEIPWEPSLFMLAKLRPGVSPAQAQEQLAALPVTLPPQVIPYFGDRVPAVLTMRDVQKVLRPELYLVLLGAVGFLFGIACFNAANLMMLRMLGRQRELSIRLALGGGRGRLVRLFVLESLVLSLLATAGGLLLANWLAPLFQAGRTADAALQWNQWSLDGRALVVLAGLTFVTSLMIVVVPAWRILRAPLSSGLKDGGAALGESRRLARLRGALVLLQAAFAVILLTGAGLMVRTFERLQEVPLGFDPARLIKANLGFPSGHLTGKEERLALLKRLQEHLQRVPGVTHVAYGTDNVLPGWDVQSDTVQMADGSPVKVKID